MISKEHTTRNLSEDQINSFVQSLTLDANGLIPAIAQDAETKDVLMMAWMSAASVQATLETGKITYWSRSRNSLWIKGETSGHTQELLDMRVDCDRDCLLLLIKQIGPACHTNRYSCFYTAIRQEGEIELYKPEKS